jgi:type II protein arginine methyltransferase
MLTCPITNSFFHTRVLSQLSSHLPTSANSSGADSCQTTNASPIEIEALGPMDTPLTPDETTGQLIGITSSWIDLSSADPIIADISRQVFKLELAYAAFCGITYVLVPGPRLQSRADDNSGILQYGRTILEGLELGPYMQLYIWTPLIDHAENDREDIGDLAQFVRSEFVSQPTDPRRLDVFGSWEVWDTVRTVCKHSSRLSVGKKTLHSA